jgi:ribosomal protein L11 methyltransferase
MSEPGGHRRLRVGTPDLASAERVMAEAWTVGAEGIEEREAAGGGTVELIIYVTSERTQALVEHIGSLAMPGVELLDDEVVEAVDWSEEWKQGLGAIEISDALVVRPSFAEHALRPGQRELVIDPGQAFGTGGHASTLLVLQWVDELMRDPDRFASPPSVLDVGTGTGVLAMAALRLGAKSAVGFDLDEVAVLEAGVWARRNGLADSFSLFAGPIEALRPTACELVLVNLLKREVLPIAAQVAAAVAPGGCAVFSGLLEADRDEVVDRFEALGLSFEAEREIHDDSGDRWVSPLLTRS